MDHRNAARDVRPGIGIGGNTAEQAGGGNRFGKDFMGAEHAESFLGQNAHDGGQQPVIARKSSAADAGEDSRPFRIGAQIEQRRPPDRADEDQIAAEMTAQELHHPAGSPEPDIFMGKRANDGGLRIVLKANNENAPAGAQGRLGHPTGKRATAGEDSERII